MSRPVNMVLAAIVVAVLLVLGIQIWGTIQISRHATAILNDVKSLPTEQVPFENEKERQEIIALRIENETKALFWTGLVGSIGVFVTVLVAFFGIWQGLRDYLNARDKERLDRVAGDLNKIWDGMANDDLRARAGAVASLQYYLSEDKGDYHARVLSALMVASRTEDQPEVQKLITFTVQQSLKQVPWQSSHQISWQRANLPNIDLHGTDIEKRDLRDFDFRDANLENADLQNCDLSGALFNAANLKGARLDNSILLNANLEYADLAGASLVGVDLTGCNLANAKILNVDLKSAKITDAKFDPKEVDWKLIKNWREADLNNELKSDLIRHYGPVVGGPKVLMLLWEFPPLVAGGAWTASYHIIRNLRKQGADLSIMVPWNRSGLNLNLFGNEVEFHAMGIIPPVSVSSSDGGDRQSSYGIPYSSYDRYAAGDKSGVGYGGFSSYDYIPSGIPSSYSDWGLSSYGTPHYAYSRYTEDGKSGFVYDRYASAYGKTRRLEKEPVGGIVKQFQQLVSRYIKRASLQFDIIYASDWPTFWAGEELSRVYHKPWIAHFHSTENDRRRRRLDEVIVAIERRGAVSANRIITPSRLTAGEVRRLYNVPDSKISIMPNPLSQDDIPVSEIGSFDTKKVIFLGRFTWQKGPDLFVEICGRLKRRLPSVTFGMFGDGEESSNINRQIALANLDIHRSGFIDWENRGSVFSNASVLLVTSRVEPFGMVMLEGMERGVSVLYPGNAGAAEVLTSGVQIKPDDIDGTVEQLYQLLTERDYWERIVEGQLAEIESYYSRNYEKILMDIFSEVAHES